MICFVLSCALYVYVFVAGASSFCICLGHARWYKAREHSVRNLSASSAHCGFWRVAVAPCKVRWSWESITTCHLSPVQKLQFYHAKQAPFHRLRGDSLVPCTWVPAARLWLFLSGGCLVKTSCAVPSRTKIHEFMSSERDGCTGAHTHTQQEHWHLHIDIIDVRIQHSDFLA